MIRNAEQMRTEVREHMRGGPGKVFMRHIIEKEELSHSRLFAEVILEPGDGIGVHEHSGETEYYWILSGSGTVAEADGERRVSAGDVVITGNGASHSIRNDGSEPLRFAALILLD
jgi:mannose-6-phosphate isomerase-like protein (cupin superfamily)